MKKFLVILFLLVFGLSFSQEKKRTLDEHINITLDSLSKVYKKKVCGYDIEIYRGVKTISIVYLENGKEVTKVVKNELVGDKRREN